MPTITVLLVEDDDAVREVMRAMLESQGYAVIDADTASEGATCSRGIRRRSMS